MDSAPVSLIYHIKIGMGITGCVKCDRKFNYFDVRDEIHAREALDKRYDIILSDLQLFLVSQAIIVPCPPRISQIL